VNGSALSSDLKVPKLLADPVFAQTFSREWEQQQQGRNETRMQ